MSHPEEAEDVMVQYVLGELRAEEARAFEQRLSTDAALAAEVRRLRSTLDLVPFASVTAPPAGLRDRILAAAAAPARRPARATAPAAQAARAPRRLVWSRFAAAAAAALALAFGLDAARVRRELSLEREVTALLQEPNVVRSFQLAGTGPASGAYGTVSLDLDAKKGVMVVKNLPVLPAGQVYRLWARVADRNVPCGEFGARPDGSVQATFAVPVESYTAPISNLVLTVEPSTPSAEPTGPTVMTSV